MPCERLIKVRYNAKWRASRLNSLSNFRKAHTPLTVTNRKSELEIDCSAGEMDSLGFLLSFQRGVRRSSPRDIITFGKVFNKMCWGRITRREMPNDDAAIEAFPAACSSAGKSVFISLLSHSHSLNSHSLALHSFRNRQLRAHLASEDSDMSGYSPLSLSSKGSTSPTCHEVCCSNMLEIAIWNIKWV